MNPEWEIRGGRENKQNWEQILQQGKQVYFESYTVPSNIDQMNCEKKKKKRAKPYQTIPLLQARAFHSLYDPHALIKQ